LVLSITESQPNQIQTFFSELAVKHYITVTTIVLFIVGLVLLAAQLNSGEERFQHTTIKTQDGIVGPIPTLREIR